MCALTARPKVPKETCQATVTCPSSQSREGDCVGSQCKNKTTVKGVGGAAPEHEYMTLLPLLSLLIAFVVRWSL